MNARTGTAVAMATLIAERISEIGMSQRQFADLVGASAKHVNLVLNGKVTARADTLDTWAEALHLRFTVEAEVRRLKLDNAILKARLKPGHGRDLWEQP